MHTHLLHATLRGCSVTEPSGAYRLPCKAAWKGKLSYPSHIGTLQCRQYVRGSSCTRSIFLGQQAHWGDTVFPVSGRTVFCCKTPSSNAAAVMRRHWIPAFCAAAVLKLLTAKLKIKVIGELIYEIYYYYYGFRRNIVNSFTYIRRCCRACTACIPDVEYAEYSLNKYSY